jgi:hypothetical protein
MGGERRANARLGGDGWGNDAQNGRGLRIRRGARREVFGWRKAAANGRRDAYLGRAGHLVAEYGPGGANRLTLRWSCSGGWCSPGASNKAKAASERAAQQAEVGSGGAAADAKGRVRRAERQSAGIRRFVELFSPSRGFGGSRRFASASGCRHNGRGSKPIPYRTVQVASWADPTAPGLTGDVDPLAARGIIPLSSVKDYMSSIRKSPHHVILFFLAHYARIFCVKITSHSRAQFDSTCF